MDTLEQEKGVQVWGMYYADKAMQRLQQAVAMECQAFWDATAPEAYQGIPIQRDTYKADGYEDDAMLLTPDLYDALLKAYEADESAESEYHADLEYDVVTPAMIGTKWLVVVDYHA